MKVPTQWSSMRSWKVGLGMLVVAGALLVWGVQGGLIALSLPLLVCAIPCLISVFLLVPRREHRRPTTPDTTPEAHEVLP